MTYNVLKGTPVDETIAALADLEADIICLQEVDRGTARSGGVDQSAALAAALAEHAVYEPSFAEDGGEFGVMILSRYPLSDVQQLNFNTSRVIGVAATAWVGESPVRVYAVHLSATHRPSISHAMLTSAERRAEATRLAELLAAEDPLLPVILAGDLNSFVGTAEYDLFAAQLADAALRVNANGPSFPAAAPAMRLDYVFVSDAFTPISGVTRRGASDHLMVIVDLDWPAAGGAE
ncbi:MAG: endonuclease/exonuclease/phosphatase family protein [Planctomycetota bacterium]